MRVPYLPLPGENDNRNYMPLDNCDAKTTVLEDIIRTCAELGVTVYEIAATQMIPSYSFVPDCLPIYSSIIYEYFSMNCVLKSSRSIPVIAAIFCLR